MTEFISFSWKKGEEGTAAVEFAMVGGAFVLLILGMFEMSRALWVVNSLQYAAERASRYAVIHGDADDAEIRDVAEESLRSLNAPSTGMTVTVEEMEGDATHPAFVSVTARIPFSPVTLPLGAVLWSDASLSAVSQRARFAEEEG